MKINAGDTFMSNFSHEYTSKTYIYSVTIEGESYNVQWGSYNGNTINKSDFAWVIKIKDFHDNYIRLSPVLREFYED